MALLMKSIDFEHIVDWSGRHADSCRRLTGEPAESEVPEAEINRLV